MGRMFAMALLVFLIAGRVSAEPPKNQQLLTPKLAALAFVHAMELNDMPGFQAVTLGAEDDYKLFEPLLGMVGSAKQLEKAAREQFGKAGRVIVRDSPAVGLEVQVQESDVQVTGDTAILRHKGQEKDDPLTIRKTAEGWKVDLTAIQNREQMSAAAPGMKKMQDALTLTTSDIRAARFKTAEEAEQVLLKRMKMAAEK